MRSEVQVFPDPPLIRGYSSAGMAKQNQQRFVDFVCNILAILPREAGEAAEARLDTQGICCKQVLDRKKRRNGGIAQLGGYSSAGRAPALQAGGQEFDPPYLHQEEKIVIKYIVNRKKQRIRVKSKE